MAPKTPEKTTPGDTGDDLIDGNGAKQLVFDDIHLSSSPPLKSALRSTQSEPLRTDAEGKVVPKRPVRIIAPEDAAIDTHSHSTVLRSDYTNLALVPQVHLDDTIHKDAETQVEDSPQTVEPSLADADPRCGLNSLNSSSLDQSSQRNLLNDVSAVHRQALTQLSRTTPRTSLDWTECEDSVWKEQTTTEPKCRSAGAAFFGVTHPTNPSSPAGLLVRLSACLPYIF